MKGKAMKKRYWRDVIWFGLGTFFGGMVLGFIGSIFRKV
jgi:hypothetical protein